MFFSFVLMASSIHFGRRRRLLSIAFFVLSGARTFSDRMRPLSLSEAPRGTASGPECSDRRRNTSLSFESPPPTPTFVSLSLSTLSKKKNQQRRRRHCCRRRGPSTCPNLDQEQRRQRHQQRQQQDRRHHRREGVDLAKGPRGILQPGAGGQPRPERRLPARLCRPEAGRVRFGQGP